MSTPKKTIKPSSETTNEKKHRVFELKITIAEVDQSIWRLFQVPADIKLSKLHRVIQKIMGWHEKHLHQFVFDGECYGPKKDIELLVDRTISSEITDDDFVDAVRDESRAKLDSLISKKEQLFEYEYDFSDGWFHTITVERILRRTTPLIQAHCLEGFGACPPEDIGGAWGYNECLSALADTNHESHYRYKEWMGQYFEADFYSVKVANTLLAKIPLK